MNEQYNFVEISDRLFYQVVAHEIAHLMGVQDRYVDSTGANKGWKNTIMGNSWSSNVTQKDVDNIIEGSIFNKGKSCGCQ